MNIKELKEIELIGIALPHKTTNENGQSARDCSELWLQFNESKIVDAVPGKLDPSVFAVYHDFDSDSTGPYAFFLGCRVEPGTEAPEGMQKLFIPQDTFWRFGVKGKIPDCIVQGWKDIWSSGIPRAYRMDFELYDGRSRDWLNAEIDIYLSVNV